MKFEVIVSFDAEFHAETDAVTIYAALASTVHLTAVEFEIWSSMLAIPMVPVCNAMPWSIGMWSTMPSRMILPHSVL